VAKVAAKTAVHGVRRMPRAPLSPRSPASGIEPLLDSLPLVLLSVDAEGRISHFQPGCQQYLTVAPESIVGRPFGRFLESIAKDHEAPGLRGLIALIRGALQGGEPPVGWHFEYLCKDENLLLRADFVLHANNGITGHTGGTLILQDVGDHHKMEAHTREVSYMASLGQTAAHVVHELRNPLSTVKAAAQLLSEGGMGEDELIHYAQMINREADRMERLAREFLAYARFPHLEYGPVFLARLLDDSREILCGEAQQRHAELVYENGRLPSVIEADGDALLQAIVNIGKNAIDAVPSGGTVKLEAKSRGKAIKVTISDNGCGISRKNREQIFDPFYTTKAHGTGLGLCIAKKIVEAHEGEIKVTSRPGQGTRVSMKLPCRK